MEIHHLSMSITTKEVEEWLLSQKNQTPFEILSFTCKEAGFQITLKYKMLKLPVQLRLLEAGYSLIRFEILSLPSILSALPLNIWQSQGIKLKGRELWIDLLAASQGRLAAVDVEELSFHQDGISFKIRNLVVREPFALKHSS